MGLVEACTQSLVTVYQEGPHTSCRDAQLGANPNSPRLCFPRPPTSRPAPCITWLIPLFCPLPRLLVQRGATWQVTVEQRDLQVQMSQPSSQASLLPWLDVSVTLRSCPQPPVTGVLGATLPLCTYPGT